MESITLDVPESVARKWKHASKELKERAVDAVKSVLDTTDEEKKNVDKETLLQEAREAFSRFSTDLSNFTFDREEANER